MKPESLRSLLTDRSLGELPQDVVELLDAYLEQNPSAEHALREVDELLVLTRRAIRTPALPSVPSPFCFAATRSPSLASRMWRWGAAPALAAAALALGFFAGRRSDLPGFDRGTEAADTGATISAADTSFAAGGIWSEERILNSARSPSLQSGDLSGQVRAWRAAKSKADSESVLP